MRFFSLFPAYAGVILLSNTHMSPYGFFSPHTRG